MTFPWSAAKQRLQPVPNHPSSNSHHHTLRFSLGTCRAHFLQSPEKHPKAQAHQEMSNNHSTEALWITQISHGSQNTQKDPILRAQASPQRGRRAPCHSSQHWKSSDPDHRSISPFPPRHCHEQRCLGEGAGAQDRERTHHKQELNFAHHYHWL